MRPRARAVIGKWMAAQIVRVIRDPAMAGISSSSPLCCGREKQWRLWWRDDLGCGCL